MKKPTALFLYVSGRTMPPSLLKRIEEAGYLPVEVPSMDAVKVMELVPAASVDPICRAAFDTIANTDWNDVRSDFGHAVARILGNPKAPAKA